MKFTSFFLGLLFMSNYLATAQIQVEGRVVDQYNEPVYGAYIFVNGSYKTFTEEDGRYRFEITETTEFTLMVKYMKVQKTLKVVPGNKKVVVRNVQLYLSTQLDETEKIGYKGRENPSIVTVDPKVAQRFPVMQFESLLTNMALGVSQSGGELSSAYNVRGGNFDENLIYVNDIEVYRPFLVRSGQQEGLSFVNPHMANDVTFSAGGFEARYGDKLSSVLDVKYNKPRTFSATVEASLLGGGIHLEDQSKNNRFTYVVGARYRTLQYVLNTLDVAGNYRPDFTDIQGLFTYRLSSKLSASYFTTFARNSFNLVPESRETSFGTIQNALKLFVGFAGSELTRYSTFLNAGTLEYKIKPGSRIKWISSTYVSTEEERFTIEGAYRLDQLENNLGSEDFAESVATLGFGYFINHARNKLDVQVISHKLMGSHRKGKHTIDWGVKYQSESITDILKEWNYYDSSEYHIGRGGRSPQTIELDDVLNISTPLNSFRLMAYVQDNAVLSEAHALKMTAGIRSHYWSVNQQNVISPRVQLSFKPNKRFNDTLFKSLDDFLLYDSLKKNDLVIKIAAGYYYQPPFYRELRNLQGQINPALRAQRSIHFVAGLDYIFKAWERPFRLIAEAYYKKLDDLVPYFQNNVRIRYDALNNSSGYAYGFDARVNGEFIKGLESWFNMSLLSTKENIIFTDEDGNQTESGFLRRPTDQRLNFSIVFQDELPMNPTYKMHLNLVYGTNVPYYFNGEFRYQERFKVPDYRRVDLGFSKELINFNKSAEDRALKYFRSFWISLEIFNVLQFNNTASYFWINDLQNNLYGVPNFLTGRRLNLKLIAKI
jgi:hypothetical protein